MVLNSLMYWTQTKRFCFFLDISFKVAIIGFVVRFDRIVVSTYKIVICYHTVFVMNAWNDRLLLSIKLVDHSSNRDARLLLNSTQSVCRDCMSVQK